MRRLIIAILIFLLILTFLGISSYYFNQYWIYRYDEIISRQASVYDLDPNLVWSVIYRETYFRTTVIGDDAEVGLMQVTPTVARVWAKETGLKEFEKESSENVQQLLSEPERNIQVGCFYLQKVKTPYRGFPAENAMMLAAYNAGPSRVEAWTKNKKLEKVSEEDFIELIKIPSTKSYVRNILKRFKETSVRLKKEDIEKKKKELKENPIS